MEVSSQLHFPAALTGERDPWYPLDRRLGEPQSRSRRGGGEKNSQHLPGLELPIIQPVAQRYTTELSRLLFTFDIHKNQLFCFAGKCIVGNECHFYVFMHFASSWTDQQKGSL
jgi:hypothetical protein